MDCSIFRISGIYVSNAILQVSYLNFERQRLPDELMKAEMLKHTGIDLDRQDVEVQVIY